MKEGDSGGHANSAAQISPAGYKSIQVLCMLMHREGERGGRTNMWERGRHTLQVHDAIPIMVLG